MSVQHNTVVVIDEEEECFLRLVETSQDVKSSPSQTEVCGSLEVSF